MGSWSKSFNYKPSENKTPQGVALGPCFFIQPVRLLNDVCIPILQHGEFMTPL